MSRRPGRRRLKLRYVLFGILLLGGIVPMLLASFLLVHQNRGQLEEQEREILVHEAVNRSQELGDHLTGIRRQLSRMRIPARFPLAETAAVMYLTAYPMRARQPAIASERA